MINQTINEVFKDNKINIFTEGHQNHIKTAIKIFKDNINWKRNKIIQNFMS